MSQSIKQLRNSIDKILQKNQSILTTKAYNKYWRDLAEHWTDYDELTNIKSRIEKNVDKSNKKSVFNFDTDLFTTNNSKNRVVKSSIKDNKKFRTTLVERIYENETGTEGLQSLKMAYHSISFIKQTLREYKNVKVSFHFNLLFLRKIIVDGKEVEEIVELTFSPKSIRILNDEQIKHEIDDLLPQAKDFIETAQSNSSNLNFIKLDILYVNISKYVPYTGGSFIELPDKLKNKKCCINIQNDDEECLKWCILYHCNKEQIKKDPQRVGKYKQYSNQFNFSGIKFPTPIEDIPKVEKIINHGINLFRYDGDKAVPFMTTERRDDKIINLLMLKEGEKQHYVYVTKLDVLISKNKFDEEGKHVSTKMYPCPNCLHKFTTQKLMDKHRENGCDLFEPQRIEYPKMKFNKETEKYETPKIYFKNFNNAIKQPVVIYADFETICKKIEHKHNSKKSSSTEFIEQVPCGYCFKVVSDYENLNMGLELYRGENCVEHFLNKLIDYGNKIKKILDTNKPMIMTKEQENEFLKCDTCHICKGKINDVNDKVRDHDHISGLYRGCSHNSCNLNLNYKNYKIPIYFHNLKGFDGHLIIKELGKMNVGNIDIIAQNFEKYVMFSFKNFQFLDSFGFLSSSLDTLASNLLKDGKENFKHTLSSRNLTDEQEKLILQKGVYPYEYMDSFQKFDETELPSKDRFYSSLNENNITDKDYKHMIIVLYYYI